MHRNKIHRIYSKIGQIYIAARAEGGGEEMLIVDLSYLEV